MTSLIRFVQVEYVQYIDYLLHFVAITWCSGVIKHGDVTNTHLKLGWFFCRSWDCWEENMENGRNLFFFTSSCLILSSSSHIRPSSTSIAFLITDAISFILSICACISCKNVKWKYSSAKTEGAWNTLKHFFKAVKKFFKFTIKGRTRQQIKIKKGYFVHHWPWCAVPSAGSQLQGRPSCWPWEAWTPALCIWSWWALMPTDALLMTYVALNEE